MILNREVISQVKAKIRTNSLPPEWQKLESVGEELTVARENEEGKVIITAYPSGNVLVMLTEPGRERSSIVKFNMHGQLKPDHYLEDAVEKKEVLLTPENAGIILLSIASS